MEEEEEGRLQHHEILTFCPSHNISLLKIHNSALLRNVYEQHLGGSHRSERSESSLCQNILLLQIHHAVLGQPSQSTCIAS